MSGGLHPNSRAARRIAEQREWMRNYRHTHFRRVFVCHCEGDIAWSRPFVQALREAGADVWFDESHRGSGSLISGVERELFRAVHVVVLSPAAILCQRVQHELDAAVAVRKRPLGMSLVLPLVAERTSTLPPQLKSYGRLFGPEGEGLAPATAATRVGYILALDDPLGQPLPVVTPPPPKDITAEDAYLRGRLLYGPGTRDDALQAWDVAIQLNPTEPRYWRERGEALRRLKRFDDALLALNRALELDSRSSGAWRIQASVLAAQNCFEAALDAAEHAIAIDDHPNAWSTKILALRRLGTEAEIAKAVAGLRQAAEEMWRRAHDSVE